MKKIFFVSLIFILLIAGCELFSSDNNSKFSTINLTLPSSRAITDDAYLYELIVSASDFDDITITTQVEFISVDVLLGTDRKFVLNLYNLDRSVLLYTGETTVDISTGSNNVIINVSAIAIEIDTYSITYDLNGGTGSLPVDSTAYLEGAEITLNDGSGIAFTGHFFSGWSLTSDGSVITPPFLMPANNIILYSIWGTAIGYYAGDGSGSGGSGDYSTDYSSDAAGGNGGGSDDVITASSGNDVIFGDGSGGGGGGEQYRVSPGGTAGSGSDIIFGGSGNDIIFGDGFNGTSGLGVGDYNGANGGFGGGGGGGGSNASPQGNGGIGGLLAGGGGAQSSTTAGTSLFGGFDGGVTSKPIGGTASNDKMWGGHSAIPYNNGSGYFTEQSLGGTGNNAFGAGGGAGFGGLNSSNQPINISTPLYNMASGGYGQGGDGTDGTTDFLLWEDSSGLLYDYVNGVLSNIFSSQIGTLDGVGSGNDIIDGQGGDDDLFGLDGDDTFVFEIDDAGSSSTDIIWDFNRLAETDILKLTISGIIISDTIRDNIITNQTTPSGTDRQLIFSDSGKTVNILIKNINRDIVSADFFTALP
ncbi:MAG: InlB B-repeat-containing protein [Spirochaetaceae bacterium]